MRTHRFAALCAGALAAVALGAAPAAGAAPRVFAAASLRDVFPQIDRAPTYNFAGSNTLQLQIERGAPADVFASASPREAQALFREGRCSRPVTFATNILVLLVPDANPGRVRSVYSLRSGGRRLAIGTPGVPIGDYARQLLRRMRLSSILTANTVSNESNVANIVSKVALGLGRRGLRLPDRRADRVRPHAVDPAAALGPAARALRALRGQAARRRRGRGEGVHRQGPRAARSRDPQARGLRAAAAGRSAVAATPRQQGRRAGFTALLALATGVVVTFLALPLVALFTQVPLGDVPRLLRDPVVRQTLAVTARTNLIANALFLGLGTPAAYLIGTRRFRGRALVITLIELPLVLPPAVAGIGLLAAFGAGGLLGDQLSAAGIVLPFSQWAVVLAVTFVASPFYVRQAIAAFEGVDRSLTDAARTLGAGPSRTFLRIALPLAAGGLAAGWVLAFARGIGEFGATIVFAGNVREETQTLTLAIYEQLESNFDVALAISILLVVLSGTVLLSYKLLSSWRRSSSTSPSPFARTGSSSA